jgi:cell volume regulation protein A
MNFTAENVLLIGSVLLLVSIIISKTGYRFGVPTLLSFLLVGMGFGSDGLGLQFSDMAQAQFIGMLSLCIILFSGGMDTKIRDIRPVVSQGILLSTLGVLLTTLFTGLFIYWISNLSFTNIHFPLTVSLLLAATMSSTDSASVFNILRSQRMNLRNHLRPTLELESGSNDPMAFMLTVVLIQFIQTGGMSPWGLVGTFLLQFVVGTVGGYLLGKGIVRTLNHIHLNNTSLYPLLLLSFAFLTYAVTYYAQGNGYLAVYIAGIVVGNERIVHRREIATFFDGMTWLFQIAIFLTLGLLVNPHEMLDVTVVAVLISVCMIFLARPLSVFLCLLPYSRERIDYRSRAFISWVGLRGAAPIIFATYPVVAGIEGSKQIFNIVFFITLLSLLVQGTSISRLARRLHLDAPLTDDGNSFGLELPDEMRSKLQELVVTPTLLAHGSTLKEVQLPDHALVMIVRRGEEHIVPNGQLALREGDVLLLISQDTTEPQNASILSSMRPISHQKSTDRP